MTGVKEWGVSLDKGNNGVAAPFARRTVFISLLSSFG